ncbi:MAG TPA: T9SS type A sorting domain-containing protein, partial [Bacteroidia bacterium]|nr:T9SS type A sorting domain-containing protein [Bacteroidia bacterium]
EYSGLYSQFIPITNIINNLVEVKTNNVSVYPNPTVDYFIAQAGDDRKVKQLSIYNFSGQMLFETSFNSVFKKEITTYPAGVYFIKIDSENNSVIKKLFVLE